MRAALIQDDIHWEDSAATLARVEPLVAAAARAGADLALLPEMFAVGFTMHPEPVAAPPGGGAEAVLRDWARRYGLTLAAGLPVAAEGGFENQALLVRADGEVAPYA